MPNLGTNPTPLELLEVSYDTLKEKKTHQKHQNMMAADMAKMQKIEKPIMKRCSDYLHYRGMGWLDNNPIGEKDPEEKFPDRVSPTFRKLKQIIEDCYAVGNPSLLQVYIDAMQNIGIEIKVDPTRFPTRVSDAAETWTCVEGMSNIQKSICELADELNFTHTQLSEDINFTPKKNYKEALGLFEKKQDQKDCDDLYQDKVTDLEMFETALNNIYDENLK